MSSTSAGAVQADELRTGELWRSAIAAARAQDALAKGVGAFRASAQRARTTDKLSLCLSLLTCALRDLQRTSADKGDESLETGLRNVAAGMVTAAAEVLSVIRDLQTEHDDPSDTLDASDLAQRRAEVGRLWSRCD
jgi:hypothetical protein